MSVYTYVSHNKPGIIWGIPMTHKIMVAEPRFRFYE